MVSSGGRPSADCRDSRRHRTSLAGDLHGAHRRRECGRRAGQHHRVRVEGRCCRNLVRLTRYRGLIQSLVARELKARYRGSVLGFFWSFVNPLLLLLRLLVRLHSRDAERARRADRAVRRSSCSAASCRGRGSPSSLLESAGVLISGGNLIKKVLFPAEILPIVTVLANMVHFFFGLVILAGFLVCYQHPPIPRAGPVSGRRRHPADLHARLRAAPVGADGALS